MRARLLAPIAAVLFGGAVAALLTRQLLRRRRNLRAANGFADQAPLEAILVYDDSVEVDTLAELADVTVHDSSELYAVPLAQQDVHLDDDRAQALGENMFEALEEEAIENGLAPEASLFLDEDDLDPPTDLRDRPIADFGAGGPRGL